VKNKKAEQERNPKLWRSWNFSSYSAAGRHVGEWG